MSLYFQRCLPVRPCRVEMEDGVSHAMEDQHTDVTVGVATQESTVKQVRNTFDSSN